MKNINPLLPFLVLCLLVNALFLWLCLTLWPARLGEWYWSLFLAILSVEAIILERKNVRLATPPRRRALRALYYPSLLAGLAGFANICAVWALWTLPDPQRLLPIPREWHRNYHGSLGSSSVGLFVLGFVCLLLASILLLCPWAFGHEDENPQ